MPSPGEVIESNTFDSGLQAEEGAALSQGMPNPGKDFETRYRLAKERLGTDDIEYVPTVGFVAIKPVVLDQNQLTIEFEL